MEELFDFRKIQRLYNKLGVPDGMFEIPWSAMPRNKYIIEMSERSTGKTTNFLLFGLCCNKIYGSTIQYIRETEDMLAPSYADKLVEVINTYNNGQYIKILTDGKYNSTYYHWKKFYYCLRDEDGKIVEKSEKSIIQCLSIDKNFDYKSSYNAPNGDVIIFDEFIGKYYRPNSCVDFLDLTKTIIRLRKRPIIIMLANTIKLTSMYFEELEISKTVRSMKRGECREITTERGTKLYVETYTETQTERRKQRDEHNTLFYGFKNPKLASITGGELWAFDSVPHIQDNKGKRVLFNRLFIDTGIELLKAQIVTDEIIGVHIDICRATKTYDDSIILVLDDITDKRQLYGFGHGRLPQIFNTALKRNLVFYTSNEVGSIFKDYLKRYQLLKKI